MMRGYDDCCNLVGGRVGEKTVRKRRMYRIQYRQGNELEEERGRASVAGRKVVVCFLGKSAIIVPAAWVKKLPIIY